MVWKHTFHSKGSIDNTRKCWPNGSNATQIWCWLCVIRLQLRAPATRSPSSWMKIKSNLCCYKRALVVRTSFKHICKPHVNIDLVISPKVIDATLNKSSMKIFIFFPCTNASQLVRSGLVHLHFVANHSLWKMHLRFFPFEILWWLAESAEHVFWSRKWMFVTQEGHQGQNSWYLNAVTVALIALVLNVCFILSC